MERENTIPYSAKIRCIVNDKKNKKIPQWIDKDCWETGRVRLTGGMIVTKNDALGKIIAKDFLENIKNFPGATEFLKEYNSYMAQKEAEGKRIKGD